MSTAYRPTRPHRTALVALALALASGPALADITITGDNGGTITKSRDCSRQDQSATCDTATVYTAPDGTTARKDRQRSLHAGEASTTVTLTAPDGTQKTRNRLVTWGN